MARYTGPRVRVSRRIGFNVFENRKGDKALQDRPYPPGENGRKRVRETDYGTQLKEKQKVRYMYGVLEKQFRNYYHSYFCGHFLVIPPILYHIDLIYLTA